MFMIIEYIENEDKQLTNTNNTINIGKGGDNFFIAHILERERYCRLVLNYADFIDRTVAKTKQLGLTRLGDKLEENKSEFKQYLIKNKWTHADMNDYEWETDEDGDHVHGKMTDNYLISTNGIRISTWPSVIISFFDQDGGLTTPYIGLRADGFTVYE